MDSQSTQIQERKSGRNGVLVTILIILALALGTLFALEVTGHSLFNKNNESKNDSGSKDNDDKTDTEISNMMIIDNALSGATIILYKGDVYFNVTNFSILLDNSKAVRDHIQTLSNSYQTYSVGHSYNDGVFYGIKLNISNVKDVYEIIDSQSGYLSDAGLAFIKNDGTLATITFQSIVLNKLTPKDAPGLKNIVKIENKNYNPDVAVQPCYVAVDTSGKTYIVRDYLKEENLLTQ